jgi:hypothetical protein
MTFQRIQVVSLVVWLGIVVSVEAAPLDLEHVSADASWLGHIDFDAMCESIVVQRALEKHTHPGHAAIVAKMLGMDLEKDLHGMTFYGKQIGKHDGVMILHAKVAPERIIGMAKMLARHTVADYRDHQLHHWSHKSRHTSKTHTVASAFSEERVVIASSVDDLKQAIDVLEGKSARLSHDSALAGNIPAGTTVLMRVEGVSDADLPDKLKVAKQTKSYRFVAGEHEGESFYRARAKMTNDEVVDQLTEILAGARALGRIHVGDNETGRKLVDALRIKPDGETLTVLWSAPADDVWAIIETHWKIFEEEMRKRRPRRGWGGPQRWRQHRRGQKDTPKEKEISPEEDF